MITETKAVAIITDNTGMVWAIARTTDPVPGDAWRAYPFTPLQCGLLALSGDTQTQVTDAARTWFA